MKKRRKSIRKANGIRLYGEMPNRRLNGWKDIAVVLGVSESTAKRYSKEHGLPVVHGPTGRPISWLSWVHEWDNEVRDRK